MVAPSGVRCCFWLNLSSDLTLNKSCLNFWLKSEIGLKSETAPPPRPGTGLEMCIHLQGSQVRINTREGSLVWIVIMQPKNSVKPSWLTAGSDSDRCLCDILENGINDFGPDINFRNACLFLKKLCLGLQYHKDDCVMGNPLQNLTEMHTTLQRKHTPPSITARWCVAFPVKMADDGSIKNGLYWDNSVILVDFAGVIWFTMKNKAQGVGFVKT